MRDTRQPIVALGRSSSKSATLHAVRLLPTIRDGKPAWSEQPMKAICGTTMLILDSSRRAESEMLDGTGGAFCPHCRDAMKWSREARKNR